MSDSQYTDIAKAPGMAAALAWLITRDNVSHPSFLVEEACKEGIINIHPENGWNVNGVLLSRRIHDRLDFMPIESSTLGRITCGIGELSARTNDEVKISIIEFFKAKKRNLNTSEFLNASAEESSQILTREAQGRFWLDAIGASQLMLTSKISWESVETSVRLLENSYQVMVVGTYGLQFSFQIALLSDLCGADDWIVKHSDKLALASALKSIMLHLHDGANISDALILLKSRTPLIVSLAVASIVWPISREAVNWSIRDCWNTLSNAGILSGDNLWLCAYRLKKNLQEKIRLEHRIRGVKTQVYMLKKNPNSARGGERFFDLQITQITSDLKDLKTAKGDVDKGTDTIVRELTSLWPRDGLSLYQLLQFEGALSNNLEVRHKLAMEISNKDNKSRLLEENLRYIQNFLGTNEDTQEVFENYFYPDQNQLIGNFPWAAKSACSLFENHTRGFGKKISDIISKLVLASNVILDQPFASVRKPTQWQSAFGRSICACIFVLTVVVEVPTDKREELRELLNYSLAHARKLFCLTSSDDTTNKLLDYLARIAVHLLTMDVKLKPVSDQWIVDDRISDFLRALILWSRPDFVAANEELAFSLLRNVAQRPLADFVGNPQFYRLLSILDIAISVSFQTKQYSRLNDIAKLWADLYQPWSILTGGEWSSIANIIIGALEGEGDDRDELLSNPSFANSYCCRVIQQSA